MADTNMPWSLKGISDEAREYAKQAAAEADMPVGVWLTAVIRAAADLETGTRTGEAPAIGTTAAAAPPVPADDGANTIERAVRIVSDFGFEPEGPAKDDDLIGDPDRIRAEIDVLEAQLARSGPGNDAAAASILEEIETLRRRLESLRRG